MKKEMIMETAKISNMYDLNDILGEIDVLVSLATLADKNRLVRPKFNSNHEIKILEGRHPVVEEVSHVDYVPNDIIMDKNCDCLLITCYYCYYGSDWFICSMS